MLQLVKYVQSNGLILFTDEPGYMLGGNARSEVVSLVMVSTPYISMV